MKWGVTYNVFDDAHEVFIHSLKSVRPHVDYICVVYQTISNKGEPCEHPTYVKDLQLWHQQGLIDELFFFEPQQGWNNEISKRNIGLRQLKAANCDYVMNMDSDELYIAEEFEFMKKTMIEGDYDGSACQMVTYYKTCEYVLDPPQTYYVPLMLKVKPDKAFGNGFNVAVDPTRGWQCEKFRAFSREEIQMHHMSYIRHDIRRKLRNSSSYHAIAHIFEHMVNLHVNFDGVNANADGTNTKVKKLQSPHFNFLI
jgi:glycosyltransferase involved in cell wall biosynthesis